LIKLPRLSGRLRLPFFRKDPTKPHQNGQNMETDLTNFLQNGAQPGMPTLHKLLLKQYSTPPMTGGNMPQASHLYPTSMAPFGMPRLPAPNAARHMGHPQLPHLPMYPMPPHLAGFHPMRPYYPRPGGVMPGMPSNQFSVLPPPPHPPPPPPPHPPKINKRPGPAPNVVFADKEPQGSGGNNYESDEIDEETPIIIRGRKHHGKRRRPIVIEEEVSSEEEDSRPIVVRGRKPYRSRGRRPPHVDDQDEPEEPYASRKRPVTYIEELPESRPYGLRGGGSSGAFDDEGPKPSGSFLHDIPTGPRSILRYTPGAGRFFHPDSSRFDSLMTSEQRNNPRATTSPGFYTGAPGSMFHDLGSIMSHHRHPDLSGFLDEPKMVLSPHIDAVTSLRDRHEAPSFFPNKLEPPPGKDIPPIVFHLPNKGAANRDKYVQALIVPIQGNIDQVAEETLDKATSNRLMVSPRGQSYVILPPRTEGLQNKQQKETGPVADSLEQDGNGRQSGPVAAQSFMPVTYVRPPSSLEPSDNRVQPAYHPVDPAQSYAQPTAIRILVRNPLDGTSKEVFSSNINTGSSYQPVVAEPQYNPGRYNYGPGNDQNRSKLVIIALPRNENRGTQGMGSPNSRSSSIVNTYYQSTMLNKRLPAASAESSTVVPLVYNQRPSSQNFAPKVPYNVVAPHSSSPFTPSSNKHKINNLDKTSYSSVSSFYGASTPSQQTHHRQKQTASSSNHARRASGYGYYRQQITPTTTSTAGIGATAQRRATDSQYARRKYTSASDSLLSELPYDAGYTTQDYPSLSKIPETSFSCHNRAPGYYASTEHKCQVYHHCTNAGSLQTFLCPNGTAFSQHTLVCEWWHDVPCPPHIKARPAAKDSSLQSLAEDPSYPVYRWPSGTHPSTTRAPQPPSYSSSVSFSVAAGNKAHTMAPLNVGASGGVSSEYALNLGRSKVQNSTLAFQSGGQKIVRTRKLVAKIRGSSASQGGSGQTRQRSKDSSTTQTPDAKSSAE
ncbi:hypothetical protein V5799_003972, partial [Amblyomma americanum]